MFPRRKESPFLEPVAGQPENASRQRPSVPWLAWVPWVLASGFALCCVVALSLAFSLRRQARTAERRLAETLRQAAEWRQQLLAWQEAARQSATNFQARLADFQQQVEQRTRDFERQKAALEAQQQARSNAWVQERVELQRQLAGRAAEALALQEALAKVLEDHKEHLRPLQVLVLRPTARAPAQASGAVVWDGTQERGLLQVHQLDPPPAERAYQLWLHDPQYPIPIRAGVLPPPTNRSVRLLFQPLFPIAQLRRVTVTEERPGGTDKPQGAVVLESP